MMLKMILRTWNYKKSYMFRNGTEIVQRKKQCILRWVHFDVETEPEKILQRTTDVVHTLEE